MQAIQFRGLRRFLPEWFTPDSSSIGEIALPNSLPYGAASESGSVTPGRRFFAAADRRLMLIALIGAAVWLRLANLGYSEFQGDEIRSLVRLNSNQSLIDFLLERGRPPLQYLVTYVLGLYDPTFGSEFLVRLPSAVAGLLSVWVFYRLALYYTNTRVALYSTFLFATNGLLVAFSKIAQYQSFVILGMILCLYWLTLAIESKRFSVVFIYLAALAALVACFAHFDGFFVIPPAIFLIHRWMQVNKSIRARWHLLFSIMLFVIPIGIFYLYLFLGVQSDTISYWRERLAGELRVSTALFTLYNGWPATLIYILFGAIGISFLYSQLRKAPFPILLVVWLVPPAFWWLHQLLMLGQLTPRERPYLLPLLVSAAAGLTIIFYCLAGRMSCLRRAGHKEIRLAAHATEVVPKGALQPLLALWIVPPFVWMEFVMSQPRTHIYTYVVPALIFVALGLSVLDQWLEIKAAAPSSVAGRLFAQAPSIGVLALLFGMTNAIFVDRHPEYPWEDKTFFGIPLTAKHMRGMMGFTYHRRWDEVSTFLDEAAGPNRQYYLTNEKDLLVAFYLPHRFIKARSNLSAQ